MSEDYLWDKTGSDAEIEGLETLLKGFAYKEQEPPPLPAKVVTLSEVKPRRFFGWRLSFGFAFAFVAVLSLGLGWLAFLRKPSTIQPEVARETQPLPVTPTEPPVSTDAKGTTSAPQPHIVKAIVAPTRQHASPVKTSLRSVERKPVPKVQEPKFTNEELYAYNQLMIALSITSSKLKIVKDKVNGTDGQVSDVTTTR